MKNAPEARILELAEKATPGPWALGHYDNLGRTPYVVDGRNYIVAGEGFLVGGEADAAYIAALSPSTVKRLCDVVEAARALRTVKQHGIRFSMTYQGGDLDGETMYFADARDFDALKVALAAYDAEGESRD